MLLLQSDFDNIHVNTLPSYDFCDVLVYCLKYEQLTLHWFSHRWIKYFWNDMGNIYIRLDFNTTRYTRHKLHLLTLTIHLYLNCSYHTFIYYTFKSCVILSWSIRGIKKYISNKKFFSQFSSKSIACCFCDGFEMGNCVWFQNYSLSFVV